MHSPVGPHAWGAGPRPGRPGCGTAGPAASPRQVAVHAAHAGGRPPALRDSHLGSTNLRPRGRALARHGWSRYCGRDVPWTHGSRHPRRRASRRSQGASRRHGRCARQRARRHGSGDRRRGMQDGRASRAGRHPNGRHRNDRHHLDRCSRRPRARHPNDRRQGGCPRGRPVARRCAAHRPVAAGPPWESSCLSMVDSKLSRPAVPELGATGRCGGVGLDGPERNRPGKR